MTSNARDTSLVLMVKAPQRSKRRLAAELGDAAAVEAARRLTACALEDLAAWPGPTWLATAASGDADALGLEVSSHALVAQGNGNLGERIARVDAALRAHGVRNLMFIGIDCPELDAEYVHRAADTLLEFDFVLGAAHDGGVVLMGARCAWPALSGLPWSTDRLRSALAAACAGGGRRVATLACRYDIDTLADLRGLGERLAHDARPARIALREWLEDEVGEWPSTRNH